MTIAAVPLSGGEGDRAAYALRFGTVEHGPYAPKDGPMREALEDWEREVDPQGKPNRPAPYVAPRVEISVHANEFLNRFTKAERIRFRAAAKAPGGEDLEDWIDHLRTASRVGLSDPQTIAGMDAPAMAGLISAERRDAILNP